MKLSEADRDVQIIIKIKRYCDDINASVERFGKSKEIFASDSDYRNSCAMSILQIGELANRLSENFRNQHDKILWRQIVDMRNILAHDYVNLDLNRIWVSIETDIPELRAFCATVPQSANDKKEPQCEAMRLKTKGFKFDREEAHEK
jgi:uncharacterized protein with HEPN domain